MKKFSISRIHTSYGIFRLIGVVISSAGSAQIKYEKVDFMGTDGWCELDLESSSAKTILTNIQSDVIQQAYVL
jgi:hypothetical protein